MAQLVTYPPRSRQDCWRCRIESLPKHYFFELLILWIYMVYGLREAASIFSLIVGIENLFCFDSNKLVNPIIQHPRQRVPPLPNLGDPRASVLLILAGSRSFSCTRQTPFQTICRSKSGTILLNRPSTSRCR